MTGREWLLIAATLLLVLSAACFAGAEAGLSRVSRVQVDEQVRHGRRGSRALLAIVADRVFYIATLLFFEVAAQVGAVVMIVHVLVDTWGGGWTVFLSAWAVGVLVTYVVVGVAARTLGRQHAGTVSRLAAPVTGVLGRVLGPIPRLLIMFGNAVTPGKGYRDGPFASEAELLDLVDLASERKVIADDEREMIHSVFELGDTIVREVMVPRTDMVVVERTKTIRQALSLSLRSGFSRLPVVGRNLDDVRGIVHMRDLTRRAYDHPKGESVETVERVTREVSFVPESKKVDALLREMQASRTHVAIVVDEYGGTAGLITIEDILEEIVGEIVDEYDLEKPLVQEVDESTTRVSVRLPVDDLGELFDVRWDERVVEDVETVGGLLARVLGRVPIQGATATVEGLTLTAEATAGRRNRIDTVLVRRHAARAAAEGSESRRSADDAGEPEPRPPVGKGDEGGAEPAAGSPATGSDDAGSHAAGSDAPAGSAATADTLARADSGAAVGGAAADGAVAGGAAADGASVDGAAADVTATDGGAGDGAATDLTATDGAAGDGAAVSRPGDDGGPAAAATPARHRRAGRAGSADGRDVRAGTRG